MTPPPPPHTTFKEITIHTAKCDECNTHNRDTVYRCRDCGWQCCTPCWIGRGEQGGHVRERMIGVVAVFGQVVEKGDGVGVGRRRETRKRIRVVVDSEDEDEDEMVQGTGRKRAREVGGKEGEEEEEEGRAEAGTGDARSRLRPRQTPEEKVRPVSTRKRRRKETVPATQPAARRLRSRVEPPKVPTPDYSRDHQGLLMLLEAAEYLERNSEPSTRETTQSFHGNGVSRTENQSPLFCPNDPGAETEEASADEDIIKVVEGLRKKRARADEQRHGVANGRVRKAKAMQGGGRRRTRNSNA